MAGRLRAKCVEANDASKTRTTHFAGRFVHEARICRSVARRCSGLPGCCRIGFGSRFWFLVRLVVRQQLPAAAVLDRLRLPTPLPAAVLDWLRLPTSLPAPVRPLLPAAASLWPTHDAPLRQQPLVGSDKTDQRTTKPRSPRPGFFRCSRRLTPLPLPAPASTFANPVRPGRYRLPTAQPTSWPAEIA